MARKNSFSYKYGTNRDYEDRTLNQHVGQWKTTEAEKRAIEAESGRDISDAVEKRNSNLDRRNKASIDERKLQDQRLNYRTAEQREKDKKAEQNRQAKLSRDEKKLESKQPKTEMTRAERYRKTMDNARKYAAADKSDRDWKNHKYLAKVKNSKGKVRYIYEDKRKTSSNGAQLIREKESNRDKTLDRDYTEGKISNEDRKNWNAEVDRYNKLTRDEKNQSGDFETNRYRKMSEERRKKSNAELDRKQKLTVNERKLQNADSRTRGKKTGTGQTQNGFNGKRDDRIKRDEVNEDTRRGEYRASVNTNSSGASYTNNYVKQYGNTRVSKL